MHQAVYILNNDFFDKKADINYSDISLKIDELTKTERIILVYDPFCSNIFEELANSHQEELLEQIVTSYYSELEILNNNKITWYQLNEFCNYHLDILNDLMLCVDFIKYSVSSIGVLPLTINKHKLFIYYHLNPYFEVDNKFYLLKQKDYISAISQISLLENLI